MSTKIATAPQQEQSLQGLDAVLPVSRREIFWRPKYLEASGYLEHLPMLFWLVGDLRPRTIVTLGAREGEPGGSAVAHLALCQAVERMGLDTDCTGLGTWEDDVETIAEYADNQYGEFARLVDISDAAAPGLFDEGSVDLLVIDRHLDPDLLDTLQAWHDRLGTEACLVLRGTEAARRDPDLAAALDAFRDGRPLLRFPHGTGAWVMAAGKTLPARLSRLADIENDRTLFRSMQQIFQRLGAACTNEWAARHAERAHGGTQRELEALREAFDARGTDLERLEESAAEAERAQQDLVAALEAEIARTDEAAEARIAHLTGALETAEGELAALRETQAAEIARLDTAHRTEVAHFTGLLAEREEQEAALVQELSARPEPEALAAAQDALAQRDTEIERLTAQVRDAEAEHARVLAEVDRARTAYEADAQRATEDRADAMRKLLELRAEIERLTAEAEDAKAVRAELAEMRGTIERQARELAELTASGADMQTGLAARDAELAARDLALGNAVQGRARLEEEIAELRGTVERQARELAELTASGAAEPRAAQLAERAVAALRRSERDASDLADALQRSQDARAAAELELESTKRELARMTGRKEHLEARIRTELGA